MARRNGGGRFYVGDDPRSFAEVGAALSLAQTLALQAVEDGTWYVREVGREGARYTVTRSDSVVLTRATS